MFEFRYEVVVLCQFVPVGFSVDQLATAVSLELMLYPSDILLVVRLYLLDIRMRVSSGLSPVIYIHSTSFRCS